MTHHKPIFNDTQSGVKVFYWTQTALDHGLQGAWVLDRGCEMAFKNSKKWINLLKEDKIIYW